MQEESMLRKIIVILGTLSEMFFGPVLDLLEKISRPKGVIWLIELKKFLRKEPTWTWIMVDTNSDPFAPDGWSVIEHKKMGQITFDPLKISLYLSKRQWRGCIEGNKLRKELEGKPVLNANVLDYLLVHPELIPEEWKGKRIYFWGTIYRGSGGDSHLYVRCLRWNSVRFDWDSYKLDNDWIYNEPALLCA